MITSLVNHTHSLHDFMLHEISSILSKLRFPYHSCLMMCSDWSSASSTASCTDLSVKVPPRYWSCPAGSGISKRSLVLRHYYLAMPKWDFVGERSWHASHCHYCRAVCMARRDSESSCLPTLSRTSSAWSMNDMALTDRYAYNDSPAALLRTPHACSQRLARSCMIKIRAARPL
jgi:hypothetical protein